MTNDKLQAVHEDIAYIRAVAQEGRRAPLLSGSILVAAGLIFGAASIGQWLVVSGALGLTLDASLWVWIASGVAFGAALFLLLGRARRKPGFHSSGNTAVGAAWSGVGLSIFAVWVSMLALGYATGDWGAMSLMPSVVLAAYGAAWMVGASMSGLKWMNLTALASYAGAAAMGLTARQPEGYLVFAAILALVALAPGLILMRQEPTEVV